MSPTSIPTQADPHANAARARVGTLVEGRWSLDALIAVGGSSAIYAATHRNGMRVAMKVLDPELSDNETAVRHFLREGRAVNGIAHPGVVSILDEGTTADGAPFLLMPLLDGETAQQRLARHPDGMPALQALAIVEAVLDVLAAAHASGIVHRDLKPDNIFLERSGAVRVLDFGIAHVSSNMELTQMGTVVGTAGYLPPEQARGQVREAGPRSDLWSVGAMLYTLLTGRVLHDSPNLIQSIIRAQNEAVPPARELIPGVLDSVAHVLDGALAFDARNRWTDAVAMRLAVRAAIDDARLALSRPANHSNAGVTIDSLACTAPSEAPVAMDGVESLDAFRATRRPLAWLAAVCVAAAWVVVAAFIAHGRPAPAPVVVAAAAPPPALDVPMVVTGSTSETAPSLPVLAPEVTPAELPVAPSASAKAPLAQAAPKGPHKAREIVRQLNF